MSIEAKRLALEALEKSNRFVWHYAHSEATTRIAEQCDAAIAALKQALEAQPVPAQEPVKPYAYEYGRDNGEGTFSIVIDRGSLSMTRPGVYNYVRPENAHKDWPIKELFDHPPAPQPVPVKTYHDGKPWPVAPKPWVGLTDEEIDTWNIVGHESLREFIRAIEAKLREKNGGAA